MRVSVTSGSMAQCGAHRSIARLKRDLSSAVMAARSILKGVPSVRLRLIDHLSGPAFSDGLESLALTMSFQLTVAKLSAPDIVAMLNLMPPASRTRRFGFRASLEKCHKMGIKIQARA